MLHYHFANFREANDWLSFDETEESVIEDKGWGDPDRYAEWADLVNRWDARYPDGDLDQPEGSQRW